MNSRMSYIHLFISIFILNLLHHDLQDRTPSSNLNNVIFSGVLQSQNMSFATDNIILSCKFKSMNRKSTKSTKSTKLKDSISKIKI